MERKAEQGGDEGRCGERLSSKDEKLCSYWSMCLSSKKLMVDVRKLLCLGGATLGMGPPLCSGNDSAAARVCKFASSMTLCVL